jgi:hypothetical protein
MDTTQELVAALSTDLDATGAEIQEVKRKLRKTLRAGRPPEYDSDESIDYVPESPVAEPLELFRFKRARHHLNKRQKLSALQMEQLIGLSGHRPIQPRLHRIDVGLPRTKMSPASQQLASFTPQDN